MLKCAFCCTSCGRCRGEARAPRKNAISGRLGAACCACWHHPGQQCSCDRVQCCYFCHSCLSCVACVVATCHLHVGGNIESDPVPRAGCNHSNGPSGRRRIARSGVAEAVGFSIRRKLGGAGAPLSQCSVRPSNANQQAVGANSCAPPLLTRLVASEACHVVAFGACQRTFSIAAICDILGGTCGKPSFVKLRGSIGLRGNLIIGIIVLAAISWDAFLSETAGSNCPWASCCYRAGSGLSEAACGKLHLIASCFGKIRPRKCVSDLMFAIVGKIFCQHIVRRSGTNDIANGTQSGTRNIEVAAR